MTTETLEETEQDQTVQPGEEQIEDKAGEITDGVDTAATEETSTNETEGEDDRFSIDGIMSEGGVNSDTEKVPGTPRGVQKKIDKEVSRRKVAEDRAQKAEQRAKELEAAQSAPKERPWAPLREDFESPQEYQEAMNKYQDDTIAYNAVLNNVKTQEAAETERVKKNDSRLLSQMEELQKKFPDVDIKETIMSVANENGFGNAAGLINDSEHNGRIALFLAKNDEERVRIGGLTDPGAINREIGKLEERFSNVRKKTTKAPAPLDTVKGDDSTVVKDLSKIEDDNKWYKEYKQQKAAKLKTKNN